MNPCKIFTPNYGPKMGYENNSEKYSVREKDLELNKNKRSNTFVSFKHKKNAKPIYIKDFKKFLEDHINKDNEANKIIIQNDILIEGSDTVNGIEINTIGIKLIGPIIFKGINDDMNNLIKIQYDVQFYVGLIKCEALNDDIESSPTIKNLALVDSDRVIKKRKEVLNSDEYIKKSEEIENENIKDYLKTLKIKELEGKLFIITIKHFESKTEKDI